ncbi:19562_t:CDS:2, partial [Gigaspora margarita]
MHWEFNNWDKLDYFIILYAKSQNFVSVICGSEYDNKVCRSHQYACEHQECNIIKNKTSIVENQWQTQSKHNGCRWQIHASCPKTTDASSYLNHAIFGEKELWALCHTSKIFTAGMQSIQRVEGQNAIIKNSVNSSTTLINLVKYINKQIGRASTFTWNFNSIEQADLIEQSDLNKEFNLTKESDINKILDNFVEDIVDAPATLVKELILTTEVELIHAVWE